MTLRDERLLLCSADYSSQITTPARKVRGAGFEPWKVQRRRRLTKFHNKNSFITPNVTLYYIQVHTLLFHNGSNYCKIIFIGQFLSINVINNNYSTLWKLKDWFIEPVTSHKSMRSADKGKSGEKNCCSWGFSTALRCAFWSWSFPVLTFRIYLNSSIDIQVKKCSF